MGRMPGLGTEKTTEPRSIFWGNGRGRYLPGGKVLDGSEARDPLNTGYLDTIRAGMLMGKITASGLFAPTVIGVLVNSADGGTGFSVSAATAVELDRRLGSCGVVGPPSAAGTVASQSGTISSVNTTTGAVTMGASLGAAAIAGSLVVATDGSETPLGILAEPQGMKVTEDDGTTNIDLELSKLCVGGDIDTAMVLNWPTNAKISAWLKEKLRLYGGGYVFKDDFDA